MGRQLGLFCTRPNRWSDCCFRACHNQVNTWISSLAGALGSSQEICKWGGLIINVFQLLNALPIPLYSNGLVRSIMNDLNRISNSKWWSRSTALCWWWGYFCCVIRDDTVMSTRKLRKKYMIHITFSLFVSATISYLLYCPAPCLTWLSVSTHESCSHIAVTNYFTWLS